MHPSHLSVNTNRINGSATAAKPIMDGKMTNADNRKKRLYAPAKRSGSFCMELKTGKVTPCNTPVILEEGYRAKLLAREYNPNVADEKNLPIISVYILL